MFDSQHDQRSVGQLDGSHTEDRRWESGPRTGELGPRLSEIGAFHDAGISLHREVKRIIRCSKKRAVMTGYERCYLRPTRSTVSRSEDRTVVAHGANQIGQR